MTAPLRRKEHRLVLALTVDGIALAARGAGAVAQALASMTSALTPAEGRRVTALLERMLASA